jgi:acyl-CoA synthetase (AMP-forming)/AMP-acid ligase II
VGLNEDDRYLIVNPFFHTFGYKAGWLACIMRGAVILPHQVFDPQSVLKRIEKDKVTVMPGPPSLYQSIMDAENFNSFDISSLRLAVTGAATIPIQLINDMRKIMNINTVLTAYGLTESTGVVTMCNPSDTPELIANTSGTPIDGVEVKCITKDGEEAASGQPGDIYIKGYNVMQGYYEEPEQTKETISEDGWLYTGDIGLINPQGYLSITDRSKDMFIVGGFNTYPAEIENILASHVHISSSAVIGIPDKRLGEVAKAFVVLKEGCSIEESELIKWCRINMANYKVPRKISFVSDLPLNASGKVMKFKLRELK